MTPPQRSWSERNPFVSLPENRLAQTALVRSLATQTRPASLVYVFGPSGSGKSHLLRQALRDALRGPRKFLYRLNTLDDLAKELGQPGDEVPVLKGIDRLSVLACEDVAALESHPDLQARLSFLLEELASAGVRVWLTATKPPGELSGVSARLVNRFHGGTVVPLQLPGLESRVTLIEHFARGGNNPLSPAIALDLARRLERSPRQLQEQVEALDQFADREKKPIDEALVDRYFRRTVRGRGPRVEAVVAAVASEFGLSVEALRSRSRNQGLVLPRQCAMLLSRELTGQPLEELGTYFGKRNRTTIAHGCERLRARLPDLPRVRQQLMRIRRALEEERRGCG